MDVPAANIGTPDLDEEMLGLIKPELASGERLIWAARSDKRPAARHPDRRLSSAVWAAGLLILSAAGLQLARSVGPLPGDLKAFVVAACMLMGFVAIVIILRLLSGLARDSERRQHSSTRTYAITDRRAIFWIPGDHPGSVEVFTLPYGTIRADGIRRVQYPDGTGDLHFRSSHRLPGGFLGIADVRRVEDLVRTHLIAPAPSSTD